ncbi:MAG: flagellar protein FlgN [Opitutales bacterium]
MHSLGQWEELADALRDELAEYGGLLALLDEQRDAIMTRRIDSLLELTQRVHEQTAHAVRFKNIRDEVCARLAQVSGCGVDATVRDLLGYMPAGARGMFEALVSDGIDVATKAKARTQRNAALITRAGDLNEKLMRAVSPGSTIKTYNARGSVYLKSGRNLGNGLDLSA